MQVAVNFDQVFGRDRASAAMGVRVQREAGCDVFVQEVAPRLVEDPVGTSICTYGALIDACVGSAVFRDSSNDQFYVGSRFGVNWLDTIAPTGELALTSRVVSREGESGTVLAVTEIRQNGRLVGQAHCRGVAVGSSSAPGDQVPISPTAAAFAPERMYSLGLEFDASAVTGDVWSGSWTTQPWMENGRGTVQGGVLLAMACEVAERIGAGVAGSGRTVSLLDIDVSVLRSPTPAKTYDLVCRIIRMGRRIGVMEIEVRDGDRSLVYSSAQVQVV